MKTVIVTGGAGFIGSNVSKKLLEKGYRVVCVDSFTDDLYDPKFKEEHVKNLENNNNFILERIDICDLLSLKSVFARERPEYVIHLAARANTRKAVEDPYSYLDINITGTLNVFELCREFEIKNVALASSSSVYGNSEDVPWKEENPADKPLSPYGMTKRADEILAYTYHHNFGLSITCLRYFNAYGENNRPDLVPYIWTRAIINGDPIEISGDGSRMRDYTYIDDIVEGTLLAMEKPLGFEIINLGNNEPISLKKLLKILEKIIGEKAIVHSRPSNKASVESTCADISRAKKVLGWQPRVSIEDGMTRLVDWVKANRLKKTV